MPASDRLQIDLRDLNAFESELKNLTKMLKGLDSVMDNLKSSIDATETSFTKGGFKKFLKDLGKSADIKKEAGKIGEEISKGISEGISKGDKSGIAGAGKKIISFVKKSLGIKSPPEWAKEIGRQIGQGIVEGLVNSINKIDPNIVKSFSSIIRNLIKVMSGAGGLDVKNLVGFTSQLENFAKSLAEALKHFNTIREPGSIARLFGSVNEIILAITNLSKILGGEKRSFFRKSFENVGAIKRMLKALGSIFKVLAESLGPLQGIPNTIDFRRATLSFLETMEALKILGEIIPSGGFLQTTFRKILLLERIRVLKPVFKIIAEALGNLSGLNFRFNPGDLSELVVAITKLLDFFERFGTSLAPRIKIFNVALPFLRRASVGLRTMKPIFKMVAKALGEFQGLKFDPGTVDGIVKTINAVMKVINTLSNTVLAGEARKAIAGGGGKIFGRDGNLKAIAKSIAEAMNEFRKVKGGADIKNVTTALNQFANSLRQIQNIQKAGDLAGLGDALGREMSNAAKSLTSGDVRRNSRKAGNVIAQEVIDATRDTLDADSPSKVFIRIGGDIVSGLRSGLKGLADLAKNQAANFVRNFRNGIGNLGRELRQAGFGAMRAGRNLLVGGGLVGLITGGATNLAAQFDQTLKEIQIFGNLADDELQKVSDTILNFSAQTIFAPRESADAFLDLQKAGLDANEAMQTIADSGNLAAAGQLGLTDANNILIRTLQTFGLEIGEATNVADTYLQAANLSTAGVQDLGEGMANVGPVAKEFGISMEETVAILALFSDAGITGGEAGTQLRSMLTNLTRPTKQTRDVFEDLGVTLADAQGNFKGITQISEEMNEVMQDLTQEERFTVLRKLGGTFGQAGLSILLTQGGVDGFIDSMQDLPGAAEVANNMMDTFAGTLESFKGSVQTLMIKALTPLMNNVLRPLLQLGIKLVNWLANLPSFVLTAASAFVLFGAALATLAGVGLIIVGSILIPMGLALTALSAIISGVIFLFANPVGLIAGAIGITVAFGALIAIATTLTAVFAAITGGIALFINKVRSSEEATAAVRELGEALGALLGSVGALFGAVIDLAGAFLGFKFAGKETEDGMSGFISFIDGITNKLHSATNAIREFVEFIRILLDVNQQLGGSSGPAGLVGAGGGSAGASGASGSRNIASGDTLWGISQELGIPLGELIAANPQIENPNLISPGQQINIPGGGSSTTTANLPRGLVASQGGGALEERALSRRIRAFGNTGLGQTLFGGQASLDSFIDKIEALREIFDEITEQVSIITSGISDIFSGEFATGFDKISDASAEIIRQFTHVFEEITGIDISDDIQIMLQNADWLGIGAVFLGKLADGIGAATSAAVGLISEKIRNLIDKALQDVFGTDIDTITTTLQPLIDNLSEGFDILSEDISEFMDSEQGQELATLFNTLATNAAHASFIIGSVLFIAFSAVMRAIGPFLTAMGSVAGIINGIIDGDWEKVAQNIGGLGEAIIELGNAFNEGVLDGLDAILALAGTDLSTVQEDLAAFLEDLVNWSDVGDAAGRFIRRMARGFERLKNALSVINVLDIDFSSIFDISDINTDSVGNFIERMGRGFDKLGNALGNIDVGDFGSVLSSIGDIEIPDLSGITGIFDIFTGAGDALPVAKDAIVGALEEIRNFIQNFNIDIPEAFTTFTDALGDVVDLGGQAVGFVSGLAPGGGGGGGGASGGGASSFSDEEIRRGAYILNNLGASVSVSDGVVSPTSTANRLPALGPTPAVITPMSLSSEFAGAFDTAIADAGLAGSIENFTGSIKEMLTAGFSGMGELATTSIIDPIVSAISAGSALIASAINAAIPDSIPIEGSLMVPFGGRQAFQTTVNLTPNPLSVGGRALGGRIGQGIFEVNESRRNVPFEMATFGNRQFILSGQDGFIQSPRGSGANGISMGGVDQSQHVNVYIEGSTNMTEQQITSAVRNALEQDRIQNQPRRQILLGGL